MNLPPLGFHSFDRVWFLTWTTYGTWLPGDERGFVSPKFDSELSERRRNVPGTPYDEGRPMLRMRVRERLVGEPILLSLAHAEMLPPQFSETANFRGWTIAAGAIMANHVHLLVGVRDDPDPSVLLRDFKSYGSRPLNARYGKPASGTWWTEQGSKRKIVDERHFRAVVAYILNQDNPLLVWKHDRLLLQT